MSVLVSLFPDCLGWEWFWFQLPASIAGTMAVCDYHSLIAIAWVWFSFPWACFHCHRAFERIVFHVFFSSNIKGEESPFLKYVIIYINISYYMPLRFLKFSKTLKKREVLMNIGTKWTKCDAITSFGFVQVWEAVGVGFAVKCT